MPIYEYACNSCAHRFETIQKAAENPLRDCPECGESTLKKLLSAPVFRLKGSGWYETDFKTGDKRNVVESGEPKGDDSTSNGGGGGGGGEERKKNADASVGGDAKPAAGGDAASPAKGRRASDGKTSGTAGGKANAARDKPKERPKPSG